MTGGIHILTRETRRNLRNVQPHAWKGGAPGRDPESLKGIPIRVLS